jgi:hypothetical protein
VVATWFSMSGVEVAKRCLAVAGAAVVVRVHEGVQERTVGHGRGYHCDVG